VTLRDLVGAAAGAAVLAVVACAHVEAPPGGPEDKQPPQLLATQPDTGARVPGLRGPVVLRFSEGLSEKGVEESVVLSPATSRVDVDKRGDEVRIELDRGWEPGRIYQVTVARGGVQDLFGNPIQEPIRLVFSTGPEIPDTRFEGRVLDRTTARPAPGARVEAALAPDSLVYATVADSAGRFVFAQVPTGTYAVRAFTDQNRSASLDPFEARDTATVVVAGRDTAERRLSIIRPDTTAPAVTGAQLAQDGTIEVRFDDYLDPAQTITLAQVTVTGPDGAPVAITAAQVGSFPARDTTGADTAGAAARPDTGRALPARPSIPGADRPGLPGRPAGVPGAGPDTVPGAAGQAAAAQETFGPVPSQSLYLRPAQPLLPDTTYRVTVTGVRNLVGLVGGGEAPLRTPRPAPPAARDTAAADSARPAPPGQPVPAREPPPAPDPERPAPTVPAAPPPPAPAPPDTAGARTPPRR
jgi:Carboxypeptidase regulatory-like domain/Bacterial Ig-like domain